MTRYSGIADPREHYDYAIVGGGVSGLYTAWRLLGYDPGGSVAVFEQNNRVGGRLLTWNPGGDNAGLRAELGGMRFFEDQQLVWKLIEQLGLADQRVPFFANGNGPNDPNYPGLIWYLRGLRTAAQDGKMASTSYRLDSADQGQSSTKLLGDAIDRVIAANADVLKKHGIDKLETRKDWDTVKPELTYGGRKLWKLGFWNLLLELVSAEAYQYIVDSFGYYTLTLNWNAAEAIQSVSLDFTSNSPYMTLSKGYDQLPKALYAAVQEHVFTATQLIGFDPNTDPITLHLADNSGSRSITAEHLVLAVPQRSLALLEPSGRWNLRTNSTLRARVATIRAYPAFKLFLAYKQRWWDDKGFDKQPIYHGRSVSDLPIRQTYYLRPDICEQGGECPDYGLVMASYDDSVAVDFWRGLEPTDDEQRTLDDHLVTMVMSSLPTFGLSGTPRNQWVKPPPLHGAPPNMIRHAHRQLAQLHNIQPTQIPEPVYGAYADWTLDPPSAAAGTSGNPKSTSSKPCH
jgi:monoamine oxidase